MILRVRPCAVLYICLLYLGCLTTQVYAASAVAATSFCKCACLTNSTLIALNPPPATPSPPSSNTPRAPTDHTLIRRVLENISPIPRSLNPYHLTQAQPQTSRRDSKSPSSHNPNHHRLTCTDCNRSFCLQHLRSSSLCATAKEEEIFATCFQRDSVKDQIIVWVFILGTGGLLGWALLKEYILPFTTGKGRGRPKGVRLSSSRGNTAGGVGGSGGLMGWFNGRRDGNGGAGGAATATMGEGDGYVPVGGHSREISGDSDGAGEPSTNAALPATFPSSTR